LAQTKIVSVSSVFPATPDEIWIRLTRIDTLQYIAAPYASFIPEVPSKEMIWREGETARFRLRIFGFLPMGIHTIQVRFFDHATYNVSTSEKNNIVPIWNHRIEIVPEGKNSARYTDEVEIGAGWLTNVVYLWSKLFYRHRQRRWHKLLEACG